MFVVIIIIIIIEKSFLNLHDSLSQTEKRLNEIQTWLNLDDENIAAWKVRILMDISFNILALTPAASSPPTLPQPPQYNMPGGCTKRHWMN